MHSIDWEALKRLRTAFLAGTAGAADYWRSETDLESYDQTFAQRIGWKWDYVLRELKRRGWSPPAGELLDWGCGTGIASRTFLAHFGAEHVTRLTLCDRSLLAMQYAARRLRESYPDIDLWLEATAPTTPATLLLSHVLTELSDQQLKEIYALTRTATSIIWVEPGTYVASRALIAVREKLRGTFNAVAPCTHSAGCGMLVAENERHWCHHFAPSPPEAFTDGNWARFGKLAGIDLRSLPVSYLVMDRRPRTTQVAGTAQAIGRPRVYKAHALVLECATDGVRDRRVTKRESADEFRRLKKQA